METTLARPALASEARAPGIAPEDFDALVREHQRRIYRVLLLVVRDPDAADTLTQECFLRAFERRATFRGEARLDTWLLAIAVNLGRDHEKNRRRAFWRRLVRGNDAAAGEVPDGGVSAERRLMAREELAAVCSALCGLSPNQRTAFVLRFGEEMPLEEIALAMGIEIGTVKSHLARAVAVVRRQVRG